MMTGTIENLADESLTLSEKITWCPNNKCRWKLWWWFYLSDLQRLKEFTILSDDKIGEK